MPESAEFFPAQIIESMIRSDRELLESLRSVRENISAWKIRTADDASAEIPDDGVLEREELSILLERMSALSEACGRKRKLLRELAEKLRGINGS